jgi:hypothetical protein
MKEEIRRGRGIEEKRRDWERKKGRNIGMRGRE